jgi:large subunit ribosomal protein L17
MRHHSKNRKFGLEEGPRHALLKSLARNLVLEKKIQTTLAKAKTIRPIVEKLVTKARTNDLSTRRLLISRTGSIEMTNALLTDLGPKYKSRQGGYTRIIKLPSRRVDGSPMAVIEFV